MGAVRLIANPRAARGEPYSEAERAGFDGAMAAGAREALRGWRGYQVTPLVDLPLLAERLGAARVAAKYEGARTELQSFKALGGAYALSRVLIELLRERGVAAHATVEDLESGRYADELSTVKAVCASDGNHGRSLAWGAKRFGCACAVYLPYAVSDGRAEAIAGYGAQVVRVNGNYDDAVRLAAADADRHGWLVVADTASGAYREIPRQVMAGYSLLADEALAQMGEAPSHVFVQVGCGGLAAVVAGYLWDRFGEARPVIVGVEPVNAACLLETVEAGEPAVVHGELETAMGGLACGEVSTVAWDVLRRGLDFAMAIPDDHAIEAVRGLAAGRFGGQPLAAGESGAAGVGALLAVAETPALKTLVGLGADSRVLVILTEGITDAAQYEAIVAAA